MAKQKLDPTDPDVCIKCWAPCCRNFSIQFDRPRTKDEYAELRWELFFDNNAVFICSNMWYRLVKSACSYLDKKNMCTNHPNRPAICRGHNPPSCEVFGNGKWFDLMIDSPEDLDKFIEKEKKKKARKRKKAIKS